MNKKVVIGLTVAAAATAYLMRDKIFGSSGGNNALQQNNNYNDFDVVRHLPSGQPATVPLSSLEDKVVLAIGNPGKYRIMKGQRVTYQEEQAYINDGSRELVWMPLAEMEKIPGAAYYISVTGIKSF
ncbi:hypothetical protein DVK85_01260 [Flavobacterium arcticum]|uniref:Uncharacterized protein n=1 Tax=Flavobacterium arcticum TaxID=1784713 RepID=A0A345H8M0_9FLAO|nr:hypothetical protein [Flavobacterium arcticum]AXG72930.1 hypothetical protein DVK85_01260 [Flavobacterium arcticum]KAF2510406.1 hypothetical protein E0W72_07945 [Flavobacterium arcticum]